MIYKARLTHPLPNITYTIGSHFFTTLKAFTCELLVPLLARLVPFSPAYFLRKWWNSTFILFQQAEENTYFTKGCDWIGV